MPVFWSESSPQASSGGRRSVAAFLLVLAVCQYHVGNKSTTSPLISSSRSLRWKEPSPSSSAGKIEDLMKQRRLLVPDQVRAYSRWFLGSGLDTCSCGCWPAVSKVPLNLLVKGRPSLSSPSPDQDAKLRRSLVDFLLGDGWAVFAIPVTLLADGRPSAAMVWSGRVSQPHGIMPKWMPCFFCLEAKAECHGSLAAPSGSVPSDDEVDRAEQRT